LNGHASAKKDDAVAIIAEAIAVLARRLSKAAFTQVRDMMTSKAMLDEPEQRWRASVERLRANAAK
jgi:hypothetical protein